MEGKLKVSPIAAAVAEMIDETVAAAPKKFIIGISLDHSYGVMVEGVASVDEAMLKFDSWLRGTLPAEALRAEIRGSNLQVIGLGEFAADGTISSAAKMQPATKVELDLRGALPDTGCIHLFSAPPTSMEGAIDMGDVTDEELRLH